MQLAKQYEYRATKECLWAIVKQNLKEVARYELNYGVGLQEIKFN
jgi:hypothetical protein